jgi:predicted house-cleaning noncanonical NTP pyrophosphatase (MazG superfamily)
MRACSLKIIRNNTVEIVLNSGRGLCLMADDALVFAVRDLTSEIIALRRQMHRDMEELRKVLATMETHMWRL